MFLPATTPPRYYGAGEDAGGKEEKEEEEEEELEANQEVDDSGEESFDEEDAKAADENLPVRQPEKHCQCPEPILEPGFPRWWKKADSPPAPKKTSTKKEEQPPPQPKKDRIQLKCRGANHVLDGPCVCESETRIREMEEDPEAKERNKDYFVYRGAREIQSPYAFVRAEPGNGFPGHVGDAVHLIFKDKIKGEYQVKLADGTDRYAAVPIEYLDIIVDVDNIVQ